MQVVGTAKAYVSRFVDLSDEELAALIAMFEIRHFDKKKQIIVEGQVETYLNFMVSGLVIKYFNRDKEEMVTQIAKENDMISCYESFLSGQPSNYSVETLEPTTLMSISHAKSELLYTNNPKMERLGRLILTQQFLNKEHFEYDRIRLSSQERFIKFVKDNSDLLQRVPQKFLASYLNMKPETFSRLKHLIKGAV